MSEPTNPAAGLLDPTPNPQEPTNPAPQEPTPNPAPQVPEGYVALPTDKSTPEELADFYSKLGRPESADKYGIELANDEGAGASKAFAEAG